VKLHDDELHLLAEFRMSMREFQSFSEQVCEAAGLTSQQYQALTILTAYAGRDGVTITDLAQRLLIKHNSAVGLVDRLEKEGLLKRRSSAEDRRNVRLEFTPRGKDLVTRLALAHRYELHRVAPAFKRHFRRLQKEPNCA
jgi:DNA-binding MarR family transcriptional regulator